MGIDENGTMKEKFRGLPKKAYEAVKASQLATGKREKAFEGKVNIALEKKAMKQAIAPKKPTYLKKGYKAQVTKGALGLMKAFMPTESASASQGQMSSGRGRGRPTQSFKYQIPGVGPVPIQAFKRYISQQKAMARLNRELAIARAGQQPPPDHVRGGYPGAPDETDRFLAEDSMADQIAQQQFAQQQFAQPQMPQQQGRRITAASFVTGARNLMGSQQQPARISLMGSQQQRFSQPMYPGQRNPDLWDLWGNTGPKILNTPNIFNRPRPDRRLPLV